MLQSPAMKCFSQVWIALSVTFLFVPLEVLAGFLLPGSDCIYLGNWMPHYQTIYYY